MSLRGLLLPASLLLAGVLAVPIGLVLLMGSLSHWAAAQFQYQLVRSQLAHGVRGAKACINNVIAFATLLRIRYL